MPVDAGWTLFFLAFLHVPAPSRIIFYGEVLHAEGAGMDACPGAWTWRSAQLGSDVGIVHASGACS